MSCELNNYFPNIVNSFTLFNLLFASFVRKGTWLLKYITSSVTSLFLSLSHVTISCIDKNRKRNTLSGYINQFEIIVIS